MAEESDDPSVVVYEVVDRILAVVKRSEITKLGFIGNEQYRGAF